MQIKLKNDFWKQEPKIQINKLINIMYYTTFFLITNLIYSIIKQNTFMIIINTFITIMYIIINITYEKKDKKQE